MGEEISNGVAARIKGFQRHVIFSSSAITTGDLGGCTAKFPNESVANRTDKGGCRFKCLDPDARIELNCEIGRSVKDAWIVPKAVSADGAELTATDADRRGVDKLHKAISCSSKAGKVLATVHYAWSGRTPWSYVAAKDAPEFSHKDNVRDLFDSLTSAIIRVVDTPDLNMSLKLDP
jgi:hypothetical protein